MFLCIFVLLYLCFVPQCLELTPESELRSYCRNVQGIIVKSVIESPLTVLSFQNLEGDFRARVITWR